jgi:osmotically inducible protein OsmC
MSRGLRLAAWAVLGWDRDDRYIDSEGRDMATRTGTTTWNGDLQSGSGTVEMTSSKLGTFDVSWPGRTSEEADGSTSPEELIAAAHSACFSMAFSNELAQAGATDIRVNVRADVQFGPDPRGGFGIRGIRLTARGTAQGIDESAFVQAAEGAKVGCPVSKALTGTEITLDARLG